jgi:CheY-like chemotaxis protein
MKAPKEPTILVIENDDRIRILLRDILVFGGYRVIEASDGRSGIKYLEKGAMIDLVLTDLGMPEMNGWEVARMTKKKVPQLPVILITGWRLGPHEKKIKESGIDRIIGKPFKVNDILETVGLFEGF